MAVSNTKRRVNIRAHNNSAGVTCGTIKNWNQHQHDDSSENNVNNNKRKKTRRDKVLHVEFGFVKSLLVKYSLLGRFCASPRNDVGEQPHAPTTELPQPHVVPQVDDDETANAKKRLAFVADQHRFNSFTYPPTDRRHPVNARYRKGDFIGRFVNCSSRAAAPADGASHCYQVSNGFYEQLLEGVFQDKVK
jgi:hypothetical protein